MTFIKKILKKITEVGEKNQAEHDKWVGSSRSSEDVKAIHVNETIKPSNKLEVVGEPREIKVNYCSSCGAKQAEASKFCPSCGESLLAITKPTEPVPLENEAKSVGCLDGEATSTNENVNVDIDLGMTTEFKLSFNTVLKLDNEKLYFEYLDSFLGKVTTLLSDNYKPVYYQDIRNVTCKHGSAIAAGNILIELISGKKIKLDYSISTFRAIKERNEAADKVVKLLNLGVVGLLPEITEPDSIVDNPFGGSSSSKNTIWYQTWWVWFWLICVWPIGLYGLIKRAEPENQKKWWGVITVLFLMGLIFGDSKSNNSPSEADISPFTKMEVCKGIIAKALGRPVNIMGANKSGGVIKVTYRRPDDKKRWNYRCKLEGNKGIWAMGGGRWRTHPMDSEVTFKIVNGALYINEVHADGSHGQKIFGKSSF